MPSASHFSCNGPCMAAGSSKPGEMIKRGNGKHGRCITLKARQKARAQDACYNSGRICRPSITTGTKGRPKAAPMPPPMKKSPSLRQIMRLRKNWPPTSKFKKSGQKPLPIVKCPQRYLAHQKAGLEPMVTSAALLIC